NLSTILIIHNESIIRQRFANYLEKLGYQVLTATNGRIGLKMQAEKQPDLILTALHMPEDGGLDIIKQSYQQMPDTPIIVISDTENVDEAIQALEMGVWDYVIKPIKDLSTLGHRVNNALTQLHLARKNQKYKSDLEQSAQKHTGELEAANKALRKNKATLKEIQQLARLGNWIWDFEKEEIFWSDEMYNIYGFNKDTEPDIEKVRRHIIEEDRPTYDEALQTIGQNDVYENIEYRIKKPDGQLRYLLARAEAIFDDSGTMLSLIGTVQDITEQKEVENNLREAQRIAKTGHWIWDPQNGDLFWSDELLRIYGITRATKPSYEFFIASIHSDDRALVVQAINDALAGIKPYQVDVRITSQSGEMKSVLVQGEVTFDKSKKPVLMQGTVTDITEHKLAEGKLRQLNQAIEQSPISVMITDTNGRIQYVNPKFTQVTGYSAEEAIGQNPRMLKSDAHPPAFYQELWETIASGKEWQGEVRNQNKNGDLYWVYASIIGVKDHNGKITHYVAVNEDITQRKQFEEERVRQERLAAVGQLAAGIAHDFNNVMAVITLYSELLQRSTNLSEKETKQVKTIQQQATHAADLTRQILDFSRRSIRKPQILDLKVFLSEILSFIERTIPEHIQVEYTYTQGDYVVNADPTQLQQVITNLTVNSRDAMPLGGSLFINLSRLKVHTGEIPPGPGILPGEWIKLTVADTGVGIEADTLSHIFEPFFTTKEVGNGSGLGLAQVYGIIQQHEGSIAVESQPEAGTSITIYLPAVIEKIDNKSTKPLTTIPQGGGETILLVEDNPILLEATHAILESLNYQVVTASNGKEALDVYSAQSQQIHLILTDVVMPKMDGVKLAKELQMHSPPPKILFMSGFPNNDEMAAEMKRFGSNWLQKPLNLYQLAHTLKEILQQNHP
ncbi:MAG: PAS domain S-box protein, partial [Chloroflexi bacterium]|nr:PAS domain S-box protein [Chloroflexota bacterium]